MLLHTSCLPWQLHGNNIDGNPSHGLAGDMDMKAFIVVLVTAALACTGTAAATAVYPDIGEPIPENQEEGCTDDCGVAQGITVASILKAVTDCIPNLTPPIRI